MPTKAQKRERRRWYERQRAGGGVVFRGEMVSPEEFAELLRPRLVRDCGSYRIWKYDVQAPLTLFGHTFDGLQDLLGYINISGQMHFGELSVCLKQPVRTAPGIYCAEIYECYPVFDAFDVGDSRVYRNVFFSRTPFTPAVLTELSRLANGLNLCAVHDNLPADALPVLYHDGDSADMLLADM